MAVLSQHPEWKNTGIWKNKLSYEVHCDRAPPSGGGAGAYGEEHDKQLSAWITHQWGARVSARLAAEAIELVANQRERHPVCEYLNALTWDGTPRLDTWLTTCAGVEETPYTRAVGPKTLIGAVARAMDHGCKVDTMLVLEGPQGLRKSSLIAALVPNRAWLAEDLGALIGDKDALQGMRGKWIIEMAELANMRPSKSDKVKQFLSTCEDNYRPSYARDAQVFPRQAIFIGTLNPEGGGYLKDPTGARRFWPVQCGKVDLERARAERDQLWAEAIMRYHQDEPYWLDEATEALAKEEQADRQVENPWEARVIAYLEGEHTTDTRADLNRIRTAPLKEVRTAEIFEACMGRAMTNKDSADSQLIATALKQHGWIRTRPGVKGKRSTIWRPASMPDDQAR
ncbi:virulence-associated E family protein [Vreelandella massiliensis]|uniref:virulence-associated E family protein n=1 Tax=Vreelandella massiliensis TaxID=1816686 RepID=UPI00135649A3|nr:virulence-associated E family protein [Halomonas massiliensis]